MTTFPGPGTARFSAVIPVSIMMGGGALLITEMIG